MLLSTPNVNFSWWAGDHDAGKIAFFSVILLLVGLAIDVCLLMKTSWGRHPQSVCATELRHGTDLHR